MYYKDFLNTQHRRKVREFLIVGILWRNSGKICQQNARLSGWMWATW